MAKDFRVGDHVEWNSEAGRVRGTIIKKFTAKAEFKGYIRHASNDEPQYLIKSDKTDPWQCTKARRLPKLALRRIGRRDTKKATRKRSVSAEVAANTGRSPPDDSLDCTRLR